MRPDAEWITKRFADMAADRANHESIWRRVSDVLRPLRQNIQRTTVVAGERRHQRVYDSSPIMALSNFKAGLYGMMTNPATKWFEIRVAGQEDVDEVSSVSDWLAEVTRRLRLSFGIGMSGFYNHVPAMYADIGAFGTGIFFNREIVGEGRFHDVTISLEEAYIAENQWGEIDTVCRLMRLTAKQAIEKFGENSGISNEVRTAAKDHPSRRFEFIHYVGPNPDFVPDRLGIDGMRFISLYVEKDKKVVLLEEGFMDLPYQCPRWDVAAGEVYGRGQGELALNDILSLNQLRRTNLTVFERAANPTLLAHNELAMSNNVRQVPGSTIYGGIDANGRKRVDVLGEGKNLAIGLEGENTIRDAIKDAFFFGLMQIQGSQDMTATEFLGRQQERLRLLGPHLGRIESEFLSPLIRRRFNMLARAGQIPEAPEAIAGAPLEIQFISPLARTQRTQEAEAAVRVLNGLLAAGEARPDVFDRLDIDAYAEALDEGFGAGVLISRDEAEVIRGERNAQAQQRQMLEAAPDLARAAKDGAQAQQIVNATDAA